MSYNVTCSTEILTLVSAPFLFISVGILSELGYGVSCVHFTAPWGDICTHLAAHSSKDLNLCLPLYYYETVR